MARLAVAIVLLLGLPGCSAKQLRSAAKTADTVIDAVCEIGGHVVPGEAGAILRASCALYHGLEEELTGDGAKNKKAR